LVSRMDGVGHRGGAGVLLRLLTLLAGVAVVGVAGALLISSWRQASRQP
jgi:hypothetical protein